MEARGNDQIVTEILSNTKNAVKNAMWGLAYGRWMMA